MRPSESPPARFLATHGIEVARVAAEVGCSHNLVSYVFSGKREDHRGIFEAAAQLVPSKDRAEFLATAQFPQEVRARQRIAYLESRISDMQAEVTELRERWPDA